MPGRMHSRRFKLGESLNKSNASRKRPLSVPRTPAFTEPDSPVAQGSRNAWRRGLYRYEDGRSSVRRRIAELEQVLWATCPGKYNSKKSLASYRTQERLEMMTDARHAHQGARLVRLCKPFAEPYGSTNTKTTKILTRTTNWRLRSKPLLKNLLVTGIADPRELARRKKKVNHKRVLRVMRERGLTHRKKPRNTELK